MAIHRLLYRSEIALFGNERDVEQQVRNIVEASQIANRASGLTGALGLSSGVFVQVLEGITDAIEPTFERICRDLRHKGLKLLEFAEADCRVFPEWSMARVGAINGQVEFLPLFGVFGPHITDTAPPSTIVGLMRSMILSDRRVSGKEHQFDAA